jgi:hypothetical protein
MSTVIPPIFQQPPTQSEFEAKDQTPSWPWTQWFQAVALRLTRIVSSVPPPTPTSPGSPGQIAFDSTHLWVCVATNTWKKTTLT